MPQKEIIIIETDKTPEQTLIELAYILKHLRYHQDRWHNHFGAHNRQKRDYWQDKADTWLQTHLKP